MVIVIEARDNLEYIIVYKSVLAFCFWNYYKEWLRIGSIAFSMKWMWMVRRRWLLCRLSDFNGIGNERLDLKLILMRFFTFWSHFTSIWYVFTQLFISLAHAHTIDCVNLNIYQLEWIYFRLLLLQLIFYLAQIWLCVPKPETIPSV